MSLLQIGEPNRHAVKTREQAKESLNQRLASSGHIQPSSSMEPQGANVLFSYPLWDLAFRPFFLLASIASVVSVLWWALFLQGMATPAGSLSPVVWHIHEMVFGFAVTIAVAFLLTAAQTWTGRRSLHGAPLFVLVLLWLCARWAVWSQSELAAQLVLPLQASWWLFSITVFSKLLLSASSRRNYIFIPVLLAMMSLNIALLYVSQQGDEALALHLARSAILVFTLLIGIVAGRVIPFFTQRAVAGVEISPSPNLDRLIIAVSLLGIVSFILSFFMSLPMSPAVLLLATGILHLLRLCRWQCVALWLQPLLWSLHIAYGFLCAGLLVAGGSYFSEALQISQGLHLITLGTIGLMILAMMARVSLGHTGRPLVVSTIISVGFVLMVVAALLRFILPLFDVLLTAWLSSAVLWCVAFSIFVGVYWLVLIRARVQ